MSAKRFPLVALLDAFLLELQDIGHGDVLDGQRIWLSSIATLDFAGVVSAGSTSAGAGLDYFADVDVLVNSATFNPRRLTELRLLSEHMGVA